MGCEYEPAAWRLGLCLLFVVLASACVQHGDDGDTTDPSAPMVQRLLGTCPRPPGAEPYPEPHLTFGDDTRIGFLVPPPWQCEAAVEVSADSVLSFAVGAVPGVVAVSVRVAFRTQDGRETVVHDAAVEDALGEPAWRDVSVDLSALGNSEGVLVIDVDGRTSGASLGLGFAEPVVFRSMNRPRRNLVLILLDTLRADRVGFNGGATDTTPFLNELAAAGTVFTHAYSPSAWTRPSTATLMLGLDPSASGIHDVRHRIGREQRTLALALHEAGYATAAFSRNPNVLPLTGFDRGFERFVDAEAGDWGRTSDTRMVIDRALAEVDRVAGRPFFLYLHLNQIHAPYTPPEAFRNAVSGDPPEPSDLYDADVRFVDQQLERLWNGLRERGVGARTLWAVTADHGEEFGEHGQGSHGLTLYEEQLRIPMLLWRPGRVPIRRIEHPVRLAAFADTLLPLLDIGTEVAGQRSLLADPSAVAGPMLYSVEVSARRVHAISDGRWKYIIWMRPKASEELYDLAEDPGEQRNRLGDAPERADALAARLQQVLARQRPGVHVRVASRQRRRVRVVLETTGRIDSVWEDSLESGDRVSLDEDRKRLELRVEVKEQSTYVPAPPKPGDLEPPGVSISYPDVDEIGVVLVPPDSPLEVTIVPDDATRPIDIWAGAARAVSPIVVNANAADLEVRAIPSGNGEAVWLYRFRGASGASLEQVPETTLEEPVPDGVRKRLRALGYLN